MPENNANACILLTIATNERGERERVNRLLIIYMYVKKNGKYTIRVKSKKRMRVIKYREIEQTVDLTISR